MSEDHNKIQQNSDQDSKKEENSGPKRESEHNIDDEGYQTPTSEEHKIPEVVWSCPPPPPNKRKRLLVNGKNMKKVEVFKGRLVMDWDSELESFFKSFATKSEAAPPPPPSEPDTDTDESTSPKRRLIDK